VRLATFNLFSGRTLADGSVDPARLTAAIRRLDADVVGLQEVDRAQPRSGGADLAAQVADAAGVGPDGWRFEPALLGTPGEQWEPATEMSSTDPALPAYGVALVSRLPVRAWHVIRLASAPLRSPVLVPSQKRPGRPTAVLLPDEPRVGLAAVVEAPGIGLMTVASTHLSFVPGWNVVQLRRLTQALAALPGPTVLLGDLNLPGRLPLLGARGWRSLAPRTRTWPSPAPRVQFDHVLARGEGLPPVTRVEDLQLEISDHRALVVQLG